MEKTKAFTLIIRRWPNPKPDLFDPESYCYYVIATNDGERNPKEISWFHDGRGKAENYNRVASGWPMRRGGAFGRMRHTLSSGYYNQTTAVKRLVLSGD